jgi:hypothetical protein
MEQHGKSWYGVTWRMKRGGPDEQQISSRSPGKEEPES